MLGPEPAQLGLPLLALGLELHDAVAVLAALGLQQLRLAPGGGQLGLQGSLQFIEFGEFVPCSIQLRTQSLFGQAGLGQALLQQCLLDLLTAEARAQLHAEPGQQRAAQAERSGEI